eukprot:8381808-Lingulodinium_polyedra.AAC.1
MSRALRVDNAQRLEDISRTDIACAVRDAFDNPIEAGARGGRPRVDLGDQGSRVQALVVFREEH